MTFAYHRRLAPMLGVLLGLAVAESMVVHLVGMALWGWRVAVPLGLLDAGLVVMLALLLRSFKRRPVVLEDGLLTMRTGTKMTLAVQVGAVAGFRESWTAADLKRRDMLNMALLAWPTVVIDLDPPIVRKRRTVRAIAHCVEDPAGFRAAVMAAKAQATA